MVPRICVYKAHDVTEQMLPGLKLINRVDDRAELLTAIQSCNPEAIIIDLDEEDALDALVQVQEVAPKVGIVCVTGTPDVSRIIAAQRAGCQQVSMRPIDPNDLVSALHRILHVSDEVVDTNSTIAIFGATGGVGATTIACHLAMELGTFSEGPAALFDLDLEFGGVARALDVEPQYTIADLATAGAADRFLLEKAAVRFSSDLHMFARPPELEDAHTVAESDVRSMLLAARQSYRFVVLDLARQLSPLIGVAMEECHKLLIVIQLTVPSVDNAKRLARALVADGMPADRIEFVINRYRKGTHNCTVEMAEGELEKSAIAIVPNDYQEVSTATDSGHLLSSRSRVRAAIRELAKTLAGQDARAKDSQASPASWLQKLSLRRSKTPAASPES